jgi:hypothetical protein
MFPKKYSLPSYLCLAMEWIKMAIEVQTGEKALFLEFDSRMQESDTKQVLVIKVSGKWKSTRPENEGPWKFSDVTLRLQVGNWMPEGVSTMHIHNTLYEVHWDDEACRVYVAGHDEIFWGGYGYDSCDRRLCRSIEEYETFCG